MRGGDVANSPYDSGMQNPFRKAPCIGCGVAEGVRHTDGCAILKEGLLKIAEAQAFKRLNDTVNHPSHYTSHPSGIECITITEYMNFNVGNAVKYLWRSGLKTSLDTPADEKHVEDLEKAVWYIKREIERLCAINPKLPQAAKIS